MANQTQQPPATTNPSAGTPPVENEDQRLVRQRIADLEGQASRFASETQTAKQEASAAKGDLERASVELAGLREQNKRLTEQLESLSRSAANKDQLPALPAELPKGAAQLVESVIIAVNTEHGPVRATPRRGDVLVVGKPDDAEELQRRIGSVVRVYAVSRETAQELAKLKHIA
jgi:DNA repair exonuclease SbcCD ATPase subunit